MNKAAALSALGDASSASAVCDRAISIYRHLRDERLDKEAAPGLVAVHCLYGVDLNPLAVELAKPLPSPSQKRGLFWCFRTSKPSF
jgi:hypothetical protein